MKALKLSSDVDEKKQLKAQCGILMDVADRIKKSTEWTPLVKTEHENSKNAQIGQWAANVHVPANSGSTSGETSSLTGSSYSATQTFKTASDGLTSGNSPTSSFSPSSRSPASPSSTEIIVNVISLLYPTFQSILSLHSWTPRC